MSWGTFPVQFSTSVHRQFARDLLDLLGGQVGLQEVLVARCAAQPRLAKVDAAGEEEAAGAGPHTTLPEGSDVAAAGQTADTREQGILLAENAGGSDLDDRRPEVLILLH